MVSVDQKGDAQEVNPPLRQCPDNCQHFLFMDKVIELHTFECHGLEDNWLCHFLKESTAPDPKSLALVVT